METQSHYYTFSATFADETFTFRVIESSKKKALDTARDIAEQLAREGEAAALKLLGVAAYECDDGWEGITPGMIRTATNQ